jgi:alkylhydroperoxidase family enzyme
VTRHAESIGRFAVAILETPGEADLELRAAVEAVAAGRSSELPGDLRPYVEKVASRAYTIADADVDALREAGYSEDAIFELTLAAALGAAQVRWNYAGRFLEEGYGNET